MGREPDDAADIAAQLAGPAAPARAIVVEAAPDATREERAFVLYCHGLRAAAIAAELGVTAGTVRRWLRAGLRTLASEARAERVEQLLRAIESQRAIAGAAWEAYEREREVERALLSGELDRVRRRATRGVPRAGTRARRTTTPADESGARDWRQADLFPAEAAPEPEVVLEEYERPHHTSQGARYLAVALAAQREVARLQGLYERIGQEPPPLRITISRRPEGPENAPPPATASADDNADGEDGSAGT